MKKVLKCNEEILSKFPNILGYVRDNFGDDCTEMYVCLSDDGKSLSFVVGNGAFSILINNDGVVPFKLNDDGKLDSVFLNGVSYSFGDNALYAVIKDKRVERALSIEKVEDDNLEAPEALVTFKQYSYDSDTMCTLVYRNVYRPRDGFVPIYSFHLNDIDSLYFDYNYSKNDINPKAGILGADRQYFARYEIRDDTLEYVMVAIREYGLMDVLRNGSYNLIKEPSIARYAKCKFVDFNGDYRDTFPFTKLYTDSMINDFIEDKCFLSSVPDIDLDIYNRSNRSVEEVREVIECLHNLSLKEKEEKKILLKVYDG